MTREEAAKIIGCSPDDPASEIEKKYNLQRENYKLQIDKANDLPTAVQNSLKKELQNLEEAAKQLIPSAVAEASPSIVGQAPLVKRIKRDISKEFVENVASKIDAFKYWVLKGMEKIPSTLFLLLFAVLITWIACLHVILFYRL